MRTCDHCRARASVVLADGSVVCWGCYNKAVGEGRAAGAKVLRGSR